MPLNHSVTPLLVFRVENEVYRFIKVYHHMCIPAIHAMHILPLSLDSFASDKVLREREGGRERNVQVNLESAHLRGLIFL